MDFVENIISNIWIQRIFWSIIVILVSTLLYMIFSRILSTREKKNAKVFSNKKNRTFLKMLKSIVRYILIILTSIVVLQIFGVDVTSMLAGVGIIGIVIGFAIQDALKDIIKGFDIISDGYYNVGDVIKFGDITGKVLVTGLKTTKIQDIASDNIVSIANRNIEQVEIVSDATFINIPLPYELPLKSAESVMAEIVDKIKNNATATGAAYLGLNDFADSSMKYLIKVTSEPSVRLQARRDALHVIATVLEAHHISVPYTQLDIHTKK